MNVYGIDPAPSSDTTIVKTDEFGCVTANKQKATEMVSFCKRIADNDESALLCWDAPLTGPAFQENGRLKTRERMFSQRKIDGYFNRSAGCKTPDGISTLSYGSCSHWTISRACTGYPRVSQYDTPSQNLPFDLVTKNAAPETGLSIVEVHPALALWIMATKHKDLKEDRELYYKGSKAEAENLELLFDSLRAFAEQSGKARDAVESLESSSLQDPDELDALTAFVLGTMWIEGSKKVRLLGSYQEGTFLLPYSEDIFEGFKTFDFP